MPTSMIRVATVMTLTASPTKRTMPMVNHPRNLMIIAMSLTMTRRMRTNWNC